MTEHFKAPEKVQLSEEEIANLLDAQFKTLVIKMLTELVASVQKPDEENQDGGVGRHTAPPRTTRPDRELNSKGDQHQGNRK